MHVLHIPQGRLYASPCVLVISEGRLKGDLIRAFKTARWGSQTPYGGKDHPGGLISGSRETRRAEVQMGSNPLKVLPSLFLKEFPDCIAIPFVFTILSSIEFSKEIDEFANCS